MSAKDAATEHNLLWRKKLKALLIGLEVEHIEMLLDYGGVGDYKALGELMSKRIKEKINQNKESKG